jgi:hypothetical protein
VSHPGFSLRTTIALALQQIVLAAVLMLLIAGWLHVPEANVFEVLANIVLALVIACAAGAGESTIVLWLTNRHAVVSRIVRGTVTVLLAALLWYAVSVGLDHGSANDGLRAGYINSRFPASMRNVFSYEHLVTGFGWMWSALRWVIGGVLAAAAFACVACDAPVLGLLNIFGSRRYWMVLSLLVIAGAWITGALLTWTPGHGLRVEMISLVVRLLIVIGLDAMAIALLLQAMAFAVRGSQPVGRGEPETSQPRAAEIP